MLKIAYVSQPHDGVLPPRQNSIGLWIYEVARRFAAEWEVIVYTKGSPFGSRSVIVEGVRYRYVAMAFDLLLLKLLKPVSALRSSKRPIFSSNLYYFFYALQVALDLRRQQCDVIQLFNFSQFIPVIRFFNRRSKLVLRMSCEWLTQLDPQMIENRLRQVDLVIGCSNYITDKIRGQFGRFADRCQTVYNARDTDHFFPENGRSAPAKNGEKRLLFVGRVSPEKGVHVLVEALPEVLSRHPQVTLEIVGPTAQLPYDYLVKLSDEEKVRELASFYQGDSPYHYYSELKKKLGVLNIEKQVFFSATLPHLQLAERYRSADVFIFPSVWDEPSGNPPIEAMASGIPVISTKTGGTAEYVEDGYTGLLVDPADASALAEAINRLLDNPDTGAAMGQAGRIRVMARLSYTQLVNNLLHHYKRLCESAD